MVSSQQEEVLGVLDLVGEHEAYDFQILHSTIHVISEEQVIGLRRKLSDLKDPQQIYVFAVYVACDYQWHVQLEQVRLIDEDVLALLDEHFDLLLLEVDRLDAEVGLVDLNIVPRFEEGVNDCVQLSVVHHVVGARA